MADKLDTAVSTTPSNGKVSALDVLDDVQDEQLDDAAGDDQDDDLEADKAKGKDDGPDDDDLDDEDEPERGTPVDKADDEDAGIEDSVNAILDEEDPDKREKLVRRMAKGLTKAVTELRDNRKALDEFRSLERALFDPATANEVVGNVLRLVSEKTGKSIAELTGSNLDAGQTTATQNAIEPELDPKNLDKWDDYGYGTKGEMRNAIMLDELRRERAADREASQRKEAEDRKRLEQTQARERSGLWLEANFKRVSGVLSQEYNGWSVTKDMVAKALGGRIPNSVSDAALLVERTFVKELASHLKASHKPATKAPAGTTPASRGAARERPKQHTGPIKAAQYLRLQEAD